MALLPLNWLGVALIALAIALFVLEAKFTSFGILGSGRRGGNDSRRAFSGRGTSRVPDQARTAIGIALPFAAISVFLTTLVIRAHARKVIQE